MIQSFKVINNILLYYHIFCDIVLLYFSNIALEFLLLIIYLITINW